MGAHFVVIQHTPGTISKITERKNDVIFNETNKETMRIVC